MLRHLCGEISRSLRVRASNRMSSSMQGHTTKKTIRGLVFDMDGTLTVPCIDFADMRRRAGVPPGPDILDCINSWEDEGRKAKAYAAIAEVEAEALLNMRVMPGAERLCAFLDESKLPRGLITRNVKSSVKHFHDQHISPLRLDHFRPAITRECQFPYKPSPAALEHICHTWGISPSECIMIGDSIKDDIVCGNRAGSVTILLSESMSEQQRDALVGEMQPTHVVFSLDEIVDILKELYNLQPPHENVQG